MFLCQVWGCFLLFSNYLLHLNSTFKPLHVGRVRGVRQGIWGSAAVIALSAVKMPRRLL